MGDIIYTDIQIDTDAIAQKFENLIDEKLMLQVQDLFAKMCDPYVPMDEGHLAQSINVTPEYVAYITEYAHYVYTGEIYGPNFMIFDEDGNFLGWRSPALGKGSKYPTGRPMEYNLEKHPKATKEWDKAMMMEKGDEFIAKVKELMLRRAKELYG